MRWLDGIIDTMDMGLSKLRKIVKEREAWCTAVHGVAKSQIWLSNWKTTTNHSDHVLRELITSKFCFFFFSLKFQGEMSSVQHLLTRIYIVGMLRKNCIWLIEKIIVIIQAFQNLIWFIKEATVLWDVKKHPHLLN